MESFSFRNFSVVQSPEVFKLGTDTLVLGALASKIPSSRLLEIGSGTGAVSLMYASLHPEVEITALDIQDESAKYSSINFRNSPYSNRMTAYCKDVQQYNSEREVDLIVSNPPYFSDGLVSPHETKAKARHQSMLSLETLIIQTGRLLSSKGLALIILPFREYWKVKKLALMNHLFVKEKWEVFYNSTDHEPKSCVVCLGREQEGVPLSSKIYVRNSNGYDPSYKNLLGEFLPVDHFQ